MTTTPSTPAAPAIARPRIEKQLNVPKWVYWVGVVLGAMGFVLLVTIMFGRVGGEEFSPHDFKRRTFHYYEIPLVGLQVWPVKRFDSTGDLELLLVKDKILTPKPPEEPRWDLVQGFRGATPVAEGDALILCRYLDVMDQARARTWLDWTKKHPKLAKVLWPKVAHLAEQELYLFVPDVFALAETATDPAELDKALQSLLARKYHDFALVQKELGYHEQAAELLTEAVKLAPENDAWKKELDAAKADK